MINNFDQLVKQCNDRRRRYILRISFIVAGFILLCVALVLAYISWFAPRMSKIVSESTQKSQQIAPLVAELNATIQPSLSTFESNISTSLPESSESNISVVPTTEKPIAPVKKMPSPLTSSSSAVKVSSQQSHLFEVSSDAKASSLDMFESNPKYETALAIAYDFYNKNNFIEALIWAKKANQMDREREEAWILYAKSYYAQGKKRDAIAVLELYMNFKYSKTALELLHTWQQNP